MYLFDTNIFLEILLGQEQADACVSALGRASMDEPGWLTQFSLHAIEAIVGGKKRFDVLEKFLHFVRVHPYLYLQDTTLADDIEIVACAQNHGLDFDDALQVYVATQQKLSLVTLDRDFRNVNTIQVVHPANLR